MESLCLAVTHDGGEGTNDKLTGLVGIGAGFKIVVQHYSHAVDDGLDGRLFNETALHLGHIGLCITQCVGTVCQPIIVGARFGILLIPLVSHEVHIGFGYGGKCPVAVYYIVVDEHLVQV